MIRPDLVGRIGSTLLSAKLQPAFAVRNYVPEYQLACFPHELGHAKTPPLAFGAWLKGWVRRLADKP